MWRCKRCLVTPLCSSCMEQHTDNVRQMGNCSGRPFSGRSAKVSFGPSSGPRAEESEDLRGPATTGGEEPAPTLKGEELRKKRSPHCSGVRPGAPEAAPVPPPPVSERQEEVRGDTRGVVGEEALPPGPLDFPAPAQQARQAPRQGSGQQGAVESTVVQRLLLAPAGSPSPLTEAPQKGQSSL